ncbi:MAG TPA: sodium:solute symporter [Chitinophagaceae bacterium]|nr:sodium:solute symporter [Chitinophagaceae bacterium]
MTQLDWIILGITLIATIAYGLYKSRTTHNLDGYILANRSMPWGLVLLSIMGTQASAITFLSAPGQAYTDGMRFVQYYFGLPIAMVVICIFFVPIFSKLKVYTAYEYLENRFDNKTRALTSFLFLLQRGLSTGISVFAPSIILSSILGWNLYWTNVFMGGLLIIYTLSGGAKAVAYTQRLQLVIIFTGMFLAAYMVVTMLPEGFGFNEALHTGGNLNKLNVITTGITDGKFNWSDQYNLLSGIIGGFFLALSYFGTDQSQVGRYLTAKNLTESRMGLLMNGFIKVPMQFLILLIGVLVFSFYQFHKAPIFFNQALADRAELTVHGDKLRAIENDYVTSYSTLPDLQQSYLRMKKDSNVAEAFRLKEQIKAVNSYADSLKKEYKATLKKALPAADTNDTNYIFLRFVVDYLPQGLVGLLIAIIFLASWGSIAAALNSLASSTVVDFHRRYSKKIIEPESEFRISRWYTLAWGVFCIIVAMFAYDIGNSLIEAVNVLGSLFYGVILGVFLVAFIMKGVKNGTVVFLAALLAEIMVLLVFTFTKMGYFKLGFLWLNPIGAFGVILFTLLLQLVMNKKKTPPEAGS